MLLAFAYLLYLVGIQGVDGATCTTTTTCLATDFTLPTCTNGICQCLNSSFVPVRSGCALQLDKPQLTGPERNSYEVLLGQNFTLRCFVNGAESYEWYKGGTRISTSSYLYTDIASPSTVGAFTCKGIGSETVVVSPLSDTYTVYLLGTGGSTTSNVQPRITVDVTSPVFVSATITLFCTNIPMGYDGPVTFKVNGVNIDNPSYVTIDSTNTGKEATCSIASPHSSVTFSKPTSAPLILPSLVSTIQSVSVTMYERILKEVIVPSAFTLTCSTTPDDVYIGNNTLSYTWQRDGSVINNATLIRYTALESGTYSCTAKLGSQSAVTSQNQIKVRIEDLLYISSRQPIRGGRVTLTCGDIRTDNVKYTWTQNNKVISGQFDRKLQLDNVQMNDSAAYKCGVSDNQVYLASSSQNVSVQTTIERPLISTGLARHFGENGHFTLWCITQSYTEGMTYEWKVKGVISQVTSKYYSLPAITSVNNGEYICKAKFKDVTSDNSPVLTVTVSQPGSLCYEHNDCDFDEPGYTGRCGSNDRCVCSDGYFPKGEMCTPVSSSSVGQILSSAVVIAFFCVVIKMI
ncbi:carcinoembryonic antigen-related cell adhesion molecule 1 [Biomphalaria glabrata]|nr:carcinoembryonic antigen-related cell adhesion molecule 1 [Biomphalaria glabrata]